MRLARLQLDHFRSYATAELAPDPGLTLIAGPNGAGKTNLLESIWVTVSGRSHRTGNDADLVSHGAPLARITLDVAESGADAAERIELVLPGPGAPVGVRRRLTVNGVARRQASVSDTLRAVLFRPEEMLLLVGAPSERRRFLDAIAAQRSRAAARDQADLARVLAQRNALLRAIRAEEADPGSLAVWDEQLAQVGARVTAARLALVDELAGRIGPLHDAVAPPDERDDRVGLVYLDVLKDAWPERDAPPGDATRLDPSRLAAAIRRRLEDVRQKEIWNGMSLVGPQRDDIGITLGGLPVAAHASRGQQRTIIIALKLAETDLLADGSGPAPIVLLDDVFSELDPDRSERGLDLLRQRGQVLVTITDAGLLPHRHRHRVPVWTVGDGRLARAPRVA
ncbi:MAG TPA: DNA replication/repair protein RecF [Candidatus Limnocylindria bacterium]|nr:DNA replication/repair protein RecF [Candidatus Limnocylindria bacterium]